MGAHPSGSAQPIASRTARPTGSRKATSARHYQLFYTGYGALVGLAFPLAATLLSATAGGRALSWAALVSAQRQQPLLWIIDLMPLLLGAAGAITGRREDKLEATLAQLTRSHRRLQALSVMLEATNERLTEASQVKTQFLANMSHELRTPLNAIIGFTRLVLRKTQGQLAERQSANLELVLKSAEHLLQLVNDLLDIERIEAGALAAQITDVDVGALLRDLVSRFEPSAAERRLALELEIDAAAEALQTDAVRLRQVLDNLVANAIKYATPGTVRIAAKADGSAVVFSVRDQGPGIDSTLQQTIFQPFVQGDGSSTRREGGAGLGLHLVKSLVELLGGTIEVESQPGQGSTFRFSLPLRPHKVSLLPARQREHLAPETSATEPASSSSKLVLVVEDHHPTARMVDQHLSELGARVQVTSSGEEAITALRHELPLALLLDLQVPGVDGFEVLGRLRQAAGGATIPVIIHSALELNAEQRRKLEELGPVRIFTKGLVGSLAAVVEAVRVLLEGGEA